jgi:pimeloyl-ACP methyl ester carboxylesterase
MDQDGFARVFASGVDPVEARAMAAAQKPINIKSFTAKSGPPAWKHIKSWYLVAANDQAVPPQAEEFMAKRMGATVRSVPSGHVPMMSHPKEVADIIILAAEALGNDRRVS